MLTELTLISYTVYYSPSAKEYTCMTLVVAAGMLVSVSA